MTKLRLDKYYTNPMLAKALINETWKIIGQENITECIEPSAGNGSFSKNISNCIAYDIDPEDPSIIKQDFLQLNLPYKKGRLFIGNPPFGDRNGLSVKFYQHCCKMGDYIAFIQPISQLNQNSQLYQFDLIYSVDLGVINYSNVKLHCCFNIYKRPDDGQLNNKPDYSLKMCKMIDIRRGSDKTIPSGFDFGMCIWGNGSFGKRPEYIGQYAHEVYFYIDPTFKQKVDDACQFDKIRSYVKSISMKRLSLSRLQLYLRKEIPDIY